MNDILQFITVFIIFLFVLLITYLTTRWIGNYQKNQNTNKNIQIMEAARLSNNKYLQIVKAGNKYLLIAVCKDTVTMLTELSEEELQFKDEDIQALDTKESFQKILEQAKKMMPHK